jgi:hypothetical protein
VFALGSADESPRISTARYKHAYYSIEPLQSNYGVNNHIFRSRINISRGGELPNQGCVALLLR